MEYGAPSPDPTARLGGYSSSMSQRKIPAGDSVLDQRADALPDRPVSYNNLLLPSDISGNYNCIPQSTELPQCVMSSEEQATPQHDSEHGSDNVSEGAKHTGREWTTSEEEDEETDEEGENDDLDEEENDENDALSSNTMPLENKIPGDQPLSPSANEESNDPWGSDSESAVNADHRSSESESESSNDEDSLVPESQEEVKTTNTHTDGKSKTLSPDSVLCFDEYGNLTTYRPEMTPPPPCPSLTPNPPPRQPPPPVQNPTPKIDFSKISNEDFLDAAQTLESEMNDSFKSPKKSEPSEAINGLQIDAKPLCSKKKQSKPIEVNETSNVSDQELKQAFREEFLTAATSRYGRTRKRKTEDGFFFGTINFNELRKITSTTSPKKCKGVPGGTKTVSPEQKTKLSRSESKIKSKLDEVMDEVTPNGPLSSVESSSLKELQMDTNSSKTTQDLSVAKDHNDIVQSSLSNKVESSEVVGYSSQDIRGEPKDEKVSSKNEKKSKSKGKSHKKDTKPEIRSVKQESFDTDRVEEPKGSLEDDVEKIKQAEKQRRQSIPRRNELFLLRENQPPVNFSSERMLRRRSDVWKIKNSLLTQKQTSKGRPSKSSSQSENKTGEASISKNAESTNVDPKAEISKPDIDTAPVRDVEPAKETKPSSESAPVKPARRLRSMQDTTEPVLKSTTESVLHATEAATNPSSVSEGSDSNLAPVSASSAPSSCEKTTVLSTSSLKSKKSKSSLSKEEECESVTKYGRTVKKPQVMDISKQAQQQKSEQSKNKEMLAASVAIDPPLPVDHSNLEKLNPCQHMVGDLVWVLIKGNPLWPAIISYQPDNGEFTRLHVKQSWNGRVSCMRLYFVQFFNDNLQTYWITPTSALPFDGYAKLKDHLVELKATVKTLRGMGKTQAESMLKSTYSYIMKAETAPSNPKRERWMGAIKEGEEAMVMDRYERLQKFTLKQEDNEEKEKELEKNKKQASRHKNKPDAVKSHRVRKTAKIKAKEKTVKGVKSFEDVFSTDGTDGEFSGFEENYSSDENRNVSNLINDISGHKQSFAQYAAKHLQKFILENPNISETAARTKLRWRWKKLIKSQAMKRKPKVNTKCEDKPQTISERTSLKRKHHSVEKEIALESGDDIATKRKKVDESKDSQKGVYKVVRNEKVCYRCEGLTAENGADMVRCKGVCCGIYHLSCVGLNTVPKVDFKCVECQTGDHLCFICKKATGPRQKCTVPFCGKFYHEDCVQKWPQVSKNRHQEKFVCPRHVCHMCAANADDMNDSVARNPQFTRCLRCPTTYHTGEECIAAGSEEISQNHHICTKHLKLPKNSIHHVNVSWCFCCSKGGSLLLCDQCPAAFHADCMKITAPDGSYVCEDCENGKFPVYGDVVWVKLGLYRWWPGQVLHPRYIPDNIENLSHQQGMFCVHFFGSNDYYWVTRGRAFHYQEGDKGSKAASSKTLEMQFQKAINEALEAYREQRKRKMQLEAVRSGKGKLKPPPYVKIDSNRPVGNVRLNKLDLGAVNRCECDPFSENPCGSDEKCLNRMLMFECVREVCGAGENCGNQRFQKRQYANVRSFRTDERGWGLKTLELIKKGDFVIEYVGELIDDEEFHRRIEEMHKVKEENYYFLTIDKDIMIDAGPKGNLARFMNHSCEPNCETQKWTVGGDTRVGLFASCDIPADSELTFNYNLQCVGTEKKKCNCGAPNCSGFIGAKVQKNDSNGQKRDKLVKRKRKKKREVKISEDECYRCGGAGDLVLCDVTDCPKSYHLQCLSLEKLPKGKWICPWHHCDECGQRSIRSYRCDYCPNSFCRNHLLGNLQKVPGVGNVCQDHDTDDIETLRSLMEAKAAEQYNMFDDESRMDQDLDSSHQPNSLPCDVLTSDSSSDHSSKCTYEESVATPLSDSSQEQDLVEEGIARNDSVVAPLRMKENKGRPKKVDRVSEGHENNSSVINVNSDDSSVSQTNSKVYSAKSNLTAKNGIRSKRNAPDTLAKAVSAV